MLTYITTYYNEPEYLEQLLQQFKELDDERLSLIVVDDGSSTPAQTLFDQYAVPRSTLYVVSDDIGFNSHGCRNLAMQETKTEWNVLIDIDYRLQGIPELLQQLEENQLEVDIPHFFPVAHTYDGKSAPHRASINDFLVTKSLYWEAGGYDHEYTGIHYGDREFIARMIKKPTQNNSMLFDCHLEALRSPFASPKIDTSIDGGERYSEDRKTLYVPIETNMRLYLARAKRSKRLSNDEAALITFPWSKVSEFE